MKKFIITEDDRKNILKMYGLINESNWKSCKKCIGNYSGLLDKCGFYAIERFEENYGDSNGQSMGDDYFESFDGGYTKFDKIITERLNKYIPNALGSMDNKTKMQIWSFMYNSDSKPNDKFRWLAILYLTANKNISKFDEDLTMQIIDKNDLTKWNEAIQLVNNTTYWDYNKLLKMIDGQYSTYNPDKYKSTWSYRPTALDDMYNDCINGVEPKANKVDNNIESKKQSDNLKNTDKITDNLNNIEKTTFDTSVLVNSPEAKVILDGKKLIKLGRTSVLMPTIQDVLKSVGQLPKDFTTSEKYDKKTYYAIRKFQKEKNLRIDGIIGKKTLGALGMTGSELQIKKQDLDSSVKTNDDIVNKRDSEIESKTKNTTNDSNISSGDSTSNLNFGKKIGDIISQDLKNSSYNMEPW